MKGHKGKLGVLLLALLLALAGSGIGYAQWTQSLYIDGTAITGEFAPGFVYDSCEFFRDPDDPDAECTCSFTDNDGDGYYEIVEATITNCNTHCLYKLYIRIHNYGTVPVMIDSIEITYNSPVVILEEDSLVEAQVDAGEEVICKLNIIIDEVPPGTYSFTVKLNTSSWNQ